MNIVIFAIAIVFVFGGHYFKMLRWKQFVEIYEKPNEDILLKSLTFGYIVNILFPFRCGDIIRALYAGRKMTNGIGFSIATTIVDKFLDIIVVGMLFIGLWKMNVGNDVIISSSIFYITLAVILMLFMSLSIKFSKYPKIIAKKICMIFNDNIKSSLLSFIWALISSIKDIYMKVNRKKLIINTISMWLFYLSSYYAFAMFISNYGNRLSFVDVFMFLFSSNNIFSSTIKMSVNTTLIMQQFPVITMVYMMLPAVILYLVSVFRKKETMPLIEDGAKYLKLIPQLDDKEKLLFLEGYFSGENREYFNNYISANRDISILKNYSAGSNATTLLCLQENITFFRKYAFGKDANKLTEQIEWLQNHSRCLPLTKILKEQRNESYSYYDMPYNNRAIGMYEYIHSVPIDKGWYIMQGVLEVLHKNLHTLNQTKPEVAQIKKYIDTKVTNNIKIIEESSIFKELSQYDQIIINGIAYDNLKVLKKYFEFDYMYNIFKDDIYADIHGDMTIENIICIRKNDDNQYDDFYLIDPNTGNIHESPNLDYAKLLQSLHGGYEFLMKTKEVEVDNNRINYILTRSLIYDNYFSRYKRYLEEKFTYAQVKSIFFHEIIHWLRLMPYKINKDGKRAVLFYAEFIIVLNDVINMYGGILDENQVSNF